LKGVLLFGEIVFKAEKAEGGERRGGWAFEKVLSALVLKVPVIADCWITTTINY